MNAWSSILSSLSLIDEQGKEAAGMLILILHLIAIVFFIAMCCKKDELVIKTQIISKKAIFAFSTIQPFNNWFLTERSLSETGRRLFYGRSAEAAASFVEKVVKKKIYIQVRLTSSLNHNKM